MTACYNKFLLCISFLFCFCTLSAQKDKVAIAAIEIEGNKKTKLSIILRELDIAIGDSLLILDLKPILERNQRNVQNTGLFVKSEIEIKDWDTNESQVTLLIKVHEAWYLYPYIIFELADRNFNVWWIEQQRSLKRVNYGVSIVHKNLTGQRDHIKLTLQSGYTQKYELAYNLPGVNADKTLGVFGNLFYSRRKEIAYITENNKLLFESLENDAFLLTRFRVFGGLSYRPNIYDYHTFKLQYSNNSIGNTIGDSLNPDYFLDHKKRQKHFTFYYEYTLDKRDIKPYPLNGYLFTFITQKDGFGFNEDVDDLFFAAQYELYYPLKKRLSLSFFAKMKMHFLRTKQPYTHATALGYLEDVVRGYELYVVDGLDFGLLKSTLRYEIFNKEYKLGKYMPLQQFRILPIRVYLTAYSDIGTVNAPYYDDYGDLNNKLLWGGGVGADIVVYHDKVFRLQYSLNQLGEHGFVFQFNLGF